MCLNSLVNSNLTEHLQPRAIWHVNKSKSESKLQPRRQTYSPSMSCFFRSSSTLVWAKRYDSLRALADFRNSLWAALPPSAKKPEEIFQHNGTQIVNLYFKFFYAQVHKIRPKDYSANPAFLNVLTHNTCVTVCNEFFKTFSSFQLHRRWACLLFEVADDSI